TKVVPCGCVVTARHASSLADFDSVKVTVCRGCIGTRVTTDAQYELIARGDTVHISAIRERDVVVRDFTLHVRQRADVDGVVVVGLRRSIEVFSVILDGPECYGPL